MLCREGQGTAHCCGCQPLLLLPRPSENQVLACCWPLIQVGQRVGRRCVARGGEIFVFQLFGTLRRLCVYHPHSRDSAGKDLVYGEAVLAPQGHTVRYVQVLPVTVQDGGEEKGDNFGATSSISALLLLRGRESRDRHGRAWPGPQRHNEKLGGDVRDALRKKVSSAEILSPGRVVMNKHPGTGG
jgi:hypothetical protein